MKGNTVTSYNYTPEQQAAYDLGVEHATNAASWVIDGNTDHDHIVKLAKMMDDGDPAIDDYLPAQPNLSGEWADSPTPMSLYRDIVDGDGDDTDVIDSLAEAYEAGVDDTFTYECERIVKLAL
jgi:hypothetical protein